MNSTRFQWRSLKTRVTLFTLSIFMVSLWALSFFASQLLREEMQSVLGEQQFSVVSAMAHQINDRMGTCMESLETIAKEVTPAMLGTSAALQTRLEQRPLLQLLFNAGVFVTGTDGTAIASLPTSTQRIGVNYLDRDFIAAALEGRASIGRPVIGRQLKSPIVVMAVPIRDAQEKVIGVLSGVTDLAKPNFFDQIARGRYGKTGGYLLIAPQHKLFVTASDQSRILQPVPAPGLNVMHDRYMQGYEGFGLAVSSRGVLELSAAKSIPMAGWFLVATLPAKEAFAPVKVMPRRMLLMTLLLTLLAGVSTWWVLQRQLAPLVVTASAMVALANSNRIPQPLPVTGQDEIGQLISGFNRILETWTQREGALRASEQNLAITLDSIGDAVIATDPAGRVTRMNPAAQRLCGWTLADATGHLLAEVFCIVNATTREPVADPVQRVMAHGQVVGLANHTVLLARDGREYQIADSASPIRNAAGDIVGVVLVFSDVTEKHAVQVAFNQFFEQPLNLHVIAALDGTIQRVNKGWEICLGYGKEDLEGTNFLALVHPDDQTSTLAEMVKLGQGISTFHFENRYRHKNGEFRLLAWSASVADQLLYAVAGDITDRKQAEAAFIASEKRWKFAIEGTDVGLWDWNLQTGEAFYSPRYKAMLGFAEDEIGDTADEWTKRIHPDDAPGVMAALQPYMEGKPGSATVEFRMLCKDGSWQWTLGHGLVVTHDADGKPLRMIGTNSDITAIKEHQNQLEYIAHFDALTHLPNRVLLADRLQQAMAQEQRRGQQLAVVYLDLDGFKAINDHHGHAAGDQVLITLAARMKQALREGDTLARLGGDEFVAVLIDLEDRSASLPMLTRLLAAAAQPVLVEDRTLQVSASLGVTFYPQSQDIDADQLLRQADQAMYQAKLTGKNRHYIFDAEQDSHLRGHHESLERIRLALEHHEFVLYYQSKVNMRTGKVIGAEALIRWQHPEQGLLLPAVFLPLIEDHALAVAIGEWVIDTALTQIERWRAAGLEMPVSVNIGARQLQQRDFVERLCAILAAHPQVNPDRLELEILETSALEDIAQVSRVIEACAQFGVTFALDDFGTGYSSLTYLKRLHVTLLKIDQSFVRNMLDDPDDLAILQGVIGLAAAFKRQVIAEGVETVPHGTLLLQLGCELAQGYGIARPMPAEQLPQWSATWRPDPAWSDGVAFSGYSQSPQSPQSG
ncbi:MAG: EAL domain-containing protein [Candidatus Contendobacter sp.]|nr:EAL domain-containing protein [Candidatus Contendobacter sp.]